MYSYQLLKSSPSIPPYFLSGSQIREELLSFHYGHTCWLVSFKYLSEISSHSRRSLMCVPLQSHCMGPSPGSSVVIMTWVCSSWRYRGHWPPPVRPMVPAVKGCSCLLDMSVTGGTWRLHDVLKRWRHLFREISLKIVQTSSVFSWLPFD